MSSLNYDLPDWETLDAMLVGDPLALRDVAWDLVGEVERLTRLLEAAERDATS